jgi:hypothetical protein
MTNEGYLRIIAWVGLGYHIVEFYRIVYNIEDRLLSLKGRRDSLRGTSMEADRKTDD